MSVYLTLQKPQIYQAILMVSNISLVCTSIPLDFAVFVTSPRHPIRWRHWVIIFFLSSSVQIPVSLSTRLFLILILLAFPCVAARINLLSFLPLQSLFGLRSCIFSAALLAEKNVHRYVLCFKKKANQHSKLVKNKGKEADKNKVFATWFFNSSSYRPFFPVLCIQNTTPNAHMRNYKKVLYETFPLFALSLRSTVVLWLSRQAELTMRYSGLTP